MPNNRIALEVADEGLKRDLTPAERSLGKFSNTARIAGEKAVRYRRGQGG